MANEAPLLHILVVGFHHKKGCLIEFSYPELPANAWKYLPTLSLPDGSHNFGQDTVYFNLPSLTTSSESVYGVSCYRQIPVEKLKNRTSDVTRSTVQKSVTALLSIPIYGYIEVKLSLIADCFFNQGDFEQTELLINAYQQLNACLLDNNSPYSRVPGLSPVESLNDLSSISSHGNMFHIGLPLRELVLRWKQKVLILFKMMLLQKRVICFGSPVRPMCDMILSIASLHPLLLEGGFREVACVKTSRPMSPIPEFPSPCNEQPSSAAGCVDAEKNTADLENKSVASSITPVSEEGDSQGNNSSLAGDVQKHFNRGFSRDSSVDTLAASLHPLCAVKPTEWGAPMPIFQGGCLCLPYLSLPYMDLLTDPSVIGYFIGTSNILFQQKRNLADILIDTDSMQIEVMDVDVRRQIQLTTEDLRFFDFILRNAQFPKENAEGSERWIREQFQGYTLALMKTICSCATGSKEIDTFNGYFVNQFKRTNCYVDWTDTNQEFEQRMAHIAVGHPFAGTMSVQDVKLKLANSMQTTEGGRKLNQAVNNTSKAIIQAKGAFSSWWTSMTAPTSQGQEATERRGSKTVGDDELVDSSGCSRRNDEIGTPAEEFLDSEVQVAKKEVPSPEETHHTGEVFDV